MAFFRKSVVNKLILIIIVFIPVPVLLAGFILSREFSGILIEYNRNKNLQLTEQIAQKIAENTSRYIFSVSSILTDVTTEEGVLPLANKWVSASNDAERTETALLMDEKLGYYFNYTTDLNGVYFIFRNNECYNYKSPLTNDISELKSMTWYKEMKAEGQRIRVLGRVKNSQFTRAMFNGEYSISIAANIHTSQNPAYNEVEMIYFTFRENTFDKIYPNPGLSKVGRIDIITADGEPVSSIDNRLPEILTQKNIFKDKYGWFRYKNADDDLLITYHTVPSTGWKVINTTSYRELTSDVDRIMTILVTVFLTITVLFVLVFFTSIVSMIILPIKNLIKKMQAVEGGDLNTDIPVHGQDELTHLYSSFKNMLREVKNLIGRIDREKTEKMQAEIRALQYQINPHFLFNTLNSITIMAEMYGVDNIKKMTDALTKLLLNTQDKGGMYNTLEKEIDTLASYAYIMKLKYAGRFDIVFSCDDNVKYKHILKFLLQPIVENCLLHGMSDDVFTRLTIAVSATMVQNRLFIAVEDNGIGMTEERAAEILTDEADNGKGFTRIGLSNVNKRIKLNYGSSFGLTIQSSPGKGTRVVAELPVLDDHTCSKAGEKLV